MKKLKISLMAAILVSNSLFVSNTLVKAKAVVSKSQFGEGTIFVAF